MIQNSSRGFYFIINIQMNGRVNGHKEHSIPFTKNKHTNSMRKGQQMIQHRVLGGFYFYLTSSSPFALSYKIFEIRINSLLV